MHRPSGTVTFLFTDIEGSTRRWESDPEAMRAALAAHDEVLRSAIDAQGGWLFKHTGDGVCAAFGSARAAVDAAVVAQRELELPVRMGVATGEAEQGDGDYFGPVLNRVARVMAAGHGGQILLAASTAALLEGNDLVDMGEHRLRDLSGPTHLFQVRAAGLGDLFPPLRTLDAVPGNLPVQATSFVGRDVEVKELTELVRAYRLVTLTGVGGVGKTRLAIQVAAEVTGEFPDGVWLVELAPVGDPAAVGDVVATALGVSPQARMSVTACVAQAVTGRRLLIVLDNCEHVLDAAAELVETILAGASTVKMLATSREGLRVGAERLWAVPSLDVRAGTTSAAVALFMDRARSVNAVFELRSDADATAVAEICARLDGIALAIELAAARIVSMSAQEVRDRLGDRFRLLSGSRRGVERHQTLRHAVSWSYDLLTDDERTMLDRCSVFAGGFDLAAATYVNCSRDEYAVLDVLDSLVRKSLLTVEQTGGHTRYGLLETIRQFAGEQLAESGSIVEVRDRHAVYFAEQVLAYWALWDGPSQRVAHDWGDAEFDNLRAAYRWARDAGALATAAAIAAHATMLGFALQRFEPVGWAEEILPAASQADLVQLPRLYAAASLCAYTGRPEEGVAYAETAVSLQAYPRYDPLPHSLSRYWEAAAHTYAGRLQRALEIVDDLAAQPGPAHVYGHCTKAQLLARLGRSHEAIAVADEALAAARAHANPYFVAQALHDHGLAYERHDASRALESYRQGLTYAREQQLPFWVANIARDAAHLEALHGDLNRALMLYDAAIDSFHRAGDIANLATALLSLASSFRRRPEIAATLYGSSTQLSTTTSGFRPDRLRGVLGDAAFDHCVTTGAGMRPAEAVRYARDQIEMVRKALPHEAPQPRGDH